MAAIKALVAPHIVVDERGVAYIEGTATKVIEVVRNQRGSGATPEELASDLKHLTLGEIYAALAYLEDNRNALEFEIEQRKREAYEILERQPAHLSRAELQRRRSLPR